MRKTAGPFQKKLVDSWGRLMGRGSWPFFIDKNPTICRIWHRLNLSVNFEAAWAVTEVRIGVLELRYL